MNVIENTLTLGYETWDDPGDYPSGAGGAALPSYEYPVVDGHITIVLGADGRRLLLSNEDLFWEKADDILREEVSEEVGVGVEEIGSKLELRKGDGFPLRVVMWVEEAVE